MALHSMSHVKLKFDYILYTGKIAQCQNEGEIRTYCDHYNPVNNEIFFNQRHKNFIDIMDFYRSGRCVDVIFNTCGASHPATWAETKIRLLLINLSAL